MFRGDSLGIRLVGCRGLFSRIGGCTGMGVMVGIVVFRKAGVCRFRICLRN